MKNKILLSLALGLAGAAQLMAGNVDIYITGSTAFRANCFTACEKLFVGGTPTIYYGDGAHGGTTYTGTALPTKTASWVMTGTPITSLTNLQGNTLIIHGLFTGSIQGIQSIQTQQQLTWALPIGTPNQNATAYTNVTPTIAFSDASGAVTPYPADNVNIGEQNVCVQPFVVCTSVAGGAVSSITNVSWEQLYYGIPKGRIPLSAWTYNKSDTNTFIYLLQRTGDSGTRRTETQGEFYQFGSTVGSYIYDATNNDFYNGATAALTNFTFGVSNATVVAGVIGSEGPGLTGANLAWGPGYIGGGDIANTLLLPNAANQSIAVLSMSDSKSVGTSGANWGTVVSFDGYWPTRAGIGLHGLPNTSTNDFSPITTGYYPIWGYEVIQFPVSSTALEADQNVTLTELTGVNSGSWNPATGAVPGSFLAVFNAQGGATPVAGSIDNEIFLTETTPSLFPNTAIRLSEMSSKRSSVGGVINPF